jgi:hypothetical protein
MSLSPDHGAAEPEAAEGVSFVDVGQADCITVVSGRCS